MPSLLVNHQHLAIGPRVGLGNVKGAAMFHSTIRVLFIIILQRWHGSPVHHNVLTVLRVIVLPVKVWLLYLCNFPLIKTFRVEKDRLVQRLPNLCPLVKEVLGRLNV
jgi:hypothetical protein